MNVPYCVAVVQKPVEFTTECALCELVMKEVDSILQGSQVKDEIENALKSVCSRLTSAEIVKECDSFVMQYTEMLIELLVKMPPKEVCSTLGLCTGVSKSPAKQQLHHVQLMSTKHNGMHCTFMIVNFGLKMKFRIDQIISMRYTGTFELKFWKFLFFC